MGTVTNANQCNRAATHRDPIRKAASDSCYTTWPIGHYQHGWEPGSESATQRHLGSFGGAGQTKFQAKMPHHNNCGCLCSQVQSNCTTVAFLLAWLMDWILSLQTIPSAVAVAIRTQLPARFGNGQWKWRPLEFSAASQIWLRNHQLKRSAVEVANPWENGPTFFLWPDTRLHRYASVTPITSAACCSAGLKLVT